MSHTFAVASRQMNLLEVQPVFHIPSNAHARNAYGTAAQEIACAALGLLPIPIDGSKSICFDASDGHFPYEIKSVHRNGKVVIYDWRMEKEATVPDSRYLLLRHSVRGHRDGKTLYQAFADNGLEAWIISTPSIHSIARRETKRVMLSDSKAPRCGYNRKGYREGYRNVGLNRFSPLLVETQLRDFTLYGIQFHITIRVEDCLLRS
jgi:hypothetical protein